MAKSAGGKRGQSDRIGSVALDIAQYGKGQGSPGRAGHGAVGGGSIAELAASLRSELPLASSASFLLAYPRPDLSVTPTPVRFRGRAAKCRQGSSFYSFNAKSKVFFFPGSTVTSRGVVFALAYLAGSRLTKEPSSRSRRRTMVTLYLPAAAPSQAT